MDNVDPFAPVRTRMPDGGTMPPLNVCLCAKVWEQGVLFQVKDLDSFECLECGKPLDGLIQTLSKFSSNCHRR